MHKALAAVAAAALALPAIAQAQATWPTYVTTFNRYVRDANIVGASTILVRDGRGDIIGARPLYYL